MERQKFEESLKKIFDQAGATPSDKVWTNIELDLERMERGDMKKRLTFFKLLAAASVVFALGVAGTGVYFLMAERSGNTELTARQDNMNDTSGDNHPADNTSPGQQAQQSEQSGDAVDAAPPDTHNTDRNIALDNTAADSPDQLSARAGANAEQKDSATPARTDVARNNLADSRDASADAAVTQRQADSHGESQSAPAPLAITGNDDAFATLVFRDRPLPALVKPKKIVPHFPKTEPDQIDLLLASIEMEERAAREKEKFDGERIWTSVGFSAGTFNNYNQSGSGRVMTRMAATTNLSSANTTLVNETEASGVSYSVGVNVGARIAPRWVLQGGINYMTQNAAFTSDAVVTNDFQNFAAAYSAEITKASHASARVVPTAPYSVNNNMEYLSIPLQAGYVLLNRSFAIQLNGGVSTDLFIQNTLQPQSGSLDKVTNGRGSDSPYRPVNFSGLVGTEFSYRFAEKYRISLNPGIRYPFSSIYKSDVGLEAMPVTFDVGLRFKYIFD